MSSICGASCSITKTEIVYDLVEKILDAAKDSGADLIVVACPLCQANLDMRQAEIEDLRGKKYNLPILYFTQLIALAFGVEKSQLRFSSLLVPVESALSRCAGPMPTGGKNAKANG